MKKLAIIAAALTWASLAQSAPIGGQVTPDDCALLGENVNLNLSANVVGAYVCTDGIDKQIGVATCSVAGRTVPRTAQVPCGEAGQPACNQDGSQPTREFRGSFVYTISSAGGRVSPSDENSLECTTAVAEAQATAVATP